MNRKIFVLIAIVMIAVVMSSCFSIRSSDRETTRSRRSSETSESTEPAQDDTVDNNTRRRAEVEVTRESAETENTRESAKVEHTRERFEFDFAESNLAEANLVENENVTFTITSINADGFLGYTLNVFIENKTDENLLFETWCVSVNGLMCDPNWSKVVSAGMTSNEEIIFYSSSFSRLGIEEVTDIEFVLTAYSYDDILSAYLIKDTFVIYPIGKDNVQEYVRVPQASDIILFDDEGCRMIIVGFEDDPLWGYTAHVFLENRTDQNLMFSINNASVNGFMCDPFWASYVSAGKVSYTSISWSASEFEANGITEVEEIVLPIRVYDFDGLTAEPLINETYTINP